MIYFSPLLTMMVAVTAPIVAGLIALMSKAFRRYGTRIQTSMGDATRVTEEALAGHRIVKVFEGQEYQQRQFAEINERNRRQFMKLLAVGAGGDTLTQYTLTIAVSAMIAVAFSGTLIPGMDASVFLGFLTAMGMLLAPLKRITNINAALQRGIAAGITLFETLDEPAEPDAGTVTLGRARGDVEFRNASFAYDESKGRVLAGVSFRAASGTTVAIVGRSGSGKSTLVGLCRDSMTWTTARCSWTALAFPSISLRIYGARSASLVRISSCLTIPLPTTSLTEYWPTRQEPPSKPPRRRHT
ncbi:MAG: hypothetical protein CM1200mP36_01010 [Gammaproteobacteria bacterium]|nr:MAG: hypothetical protein CM1200mP36_01010 [Gammaproteobacteria bacterium]